MADMKNSSKIIEVITAPLGFFVLALLIVESFLGIVLTVNTLDSAEQLNGIYLGASLFSLVIVAVFLLVWNKPDNLTFDKEAHLRSQGKAPFGSNNNSEIINNKDMTSPSTPRGQ